MSRLTLKSEIVFAGVGLHTGKPVKIRLAPAQSGAGYGFVFDGNRYPIESAGHRGDGRGTILNFDDHSVMTVEHLLAALAGLGVDDATLYPQGDETPLLDGSALDYAAEIARAGLQEQEGEKSWIDIASPLFVTSEDERKLCAVLPSDRQRFTYVIEYGDNAIGTQVADVAPTPENFMTELAPCRTFCLFEEVEQMRAMGLGLGGTVETALIVKGHEILTPGGLRRPDEFVRHKILDLLGDLTLLGRPVRGHFIALRAGHAVHQKLVDRIAATLASR